MGHGELRLRNLAASTSDTKFGTKREHMIPHEMKTFFISRSFHTIPEGSVGSLILPGGVPSFSFNIFNRSRPNTLPFGKTTGSSSMWLLD